MKFTLRSAVMPRNAVAVPAGSLVYQVNAITATLMLVSLVENPNERTEADTFLVAASEVEPV